MVFLFSARVADSDPLTVVFCSTSRSKVFDWETVSTVSFIKLVHGPNRSLSPRNGWTTKELLLFPACCSQVALHSLSLRHLFVEKKKLKKLRNCLFLLL